MTSAHHPTTRMTPACASPRVSSLPNLGTPCGIAIRSGLRAGRDPGDPIPWQLGVGINFSYTTPNILLDDDVLPPLDLSQLFP